MIFVTLPKHKSSGACHVAIGEIVVMERIEFAVPPYTMVTLRGGEIVKSSFTPMQIEREIDKSLLARGLPA